MHALVYAHCKGVCNVQGVCYDMHTRTIVHPNHHQQPHHYHLQDGTLLDSESRIDPSSVNAIKAVLKKGIHVIAATGKARPAAIAVARDAGLEGYLVSRAGPGIFLQGMAVHGRDGSLLRTARMPDEAVRAVMAWARHHRVPCCAFLGDSCVTLEMQPELRQLHELYYEPLAGVVQDVEGVLAAGDVKKVAWLRSKCSGLWSR